MSIDNCKHSLFGVSKLRIIIQEYNKNFGIKTVCLGQDVSRDQIIQVRSFIFLSYLVKSCIKKKSYNIIGYKGKQVRDNIHSHDLTRAFWEFFKKPVTNSVFNIGGGIYSNCSIIEAIKYFEKQKKFKIKKNILKIPRIGDHQWYISNISKFEKFYPKFKIKYNTSKILDEIIDSVSLSSR